MVPSRYLSACLLYTSGELPNLIGSEFAQELIDYTDKIYLEFGADELSLIHILILSVLSFR